LFRKLVLLQLKKATTRYGVVLKKILVGVSYTLSLEHSIVITLTLSIVRRRMTPVSIVNISIAQYP